MNPLRILIVEDNELNSELAVRKLERLGYIVQAFPDAESALDFCAKTSDRPDLILMDVGLPGLDGLEATERLKANAATREIPVIALTARAMEEDRLRSVAAGCQAFVTKPVDFSALDTVIRKLLGCT